jgi:hypothetical protein
MADPKDKQDDIAIMEEQDGSAVVDLPENLLQDDVPESRADGGNVNDDEHHNNHNGNANAAATYFPGALI